MCFHTHLHLLIATSGLCTSFLFNVLHCLFQYGVRVPCVTKQSFDTSPGLQNHFWTKFLILSQYPCSLTNFSCVLLPCSFTTSTAAPVALALPIPPWSAQCTPTSARRPHSASSPPWCGVWAPRTSWRKCCLPQGSAQFTSWDQITSGASKQFMFHVGTVQVAPGNLGWLCWNLCVRIGRRGERVCRSREEKLAVHRKKISSCCWREWEKSKFFHWDMVEVLVFLTLVLNLLESCHYSYCMLYLSIESEIRKDTKF